ncbi:MAG TPA: DNA polymerase III subunit delta, partial [Beijerinckiaceae bacterium]
MVEIKGAEADRWIRNLPSDIAVYLVCGQDEGLVAERARAIVRGSVEDPADPFQVVVLEGNAVAAEPERLLDEVYTIGLFGGRRLVRVSVGSRPLAPIVANVLERPSPGCTLLLEGGSIKSDSPLRKLLAGARNAVVIDCWSDDAKQLDALIDEEFVAAGLTIEPAARTLLASLIGADRLATRSELAKLTLYAHGREVVTEADVETIV